MWPLLHAAQAWCERGATGTLVPVLMCLQPRLGTRTDFPKGTARGWSQEGWEARCVEEVQRCEAWQWAVASEAT